MAGAIIAIDQARPGPSTSYGAPGVARNDLWEGRVVSVRSTQGGNGAFHWTLLAKPAGSAVTLSGDTTATATFTPDLPGSYRVQLVTNGGGTGNVQVLIAAVRYDTDGVLVNYGWRVPAFGEVPAEDNFLGQTSGWSEAMEYIFADLISRAGETGSLSSLKTITANDSPYTVLPADVALAVDASLGPVDVMLPAATDGRLIVIWDLLGWAGTNAITTYASLLQSIAGGASLPITSAYGGALLIGRATNATLGSWGVAGGASGGGPSSGTGLAKYVLGVVQAIASPVVNADVDAAAAIDVTKLALAAADGQVLRRAGGVNGWGALDMAKALVGTKSSYVGSPPFSTPFSVFTTAAVIAFDPTAIPTPTALRLKVVVETTAPQITVQLYNVTAAAVVAGSTLTSSSTFPVELTTGDLTAALGAGYAIYQVQVKMAGGGGSSDFVTLDHARLEATW